MAGPFNIPPLSVGTTGPVEAGWINQAAQIKKHEDFLRENQRLGLEFNVPATMRESGIGPVPGEVWSLPTPGVTLPPLPWNPPEWHMPAG